MDEFSRITNFGGWFEFLWTNKNQVGVSEKKDHTHQTNHHYSTRATSIWRVHKDASIVTLEARFQLEMSKKIEKLIKPRK
jgi:uncharacterized protein with NRDE domain